MRRQKVSNSMVRANLNVMDHRARAAINGYAKRNGLSEHEATIRVLGLIRKIEHESSRHIYGPAGFTPFLTFVGIKKPQIAIFERAISHAEHGRIPVMPKIPRARMNELAAEKAKEKANYPKFKSNRELKAYYKKESRNMHKKPITKLEVLTERNIKYAGLAHKYCTAYSTKYLKQAINALEKKKVSPELFNTVAHEMREVLDPYISAEISFHQGFDWKDKSIGSSVKKKLRIR